MERVAVVTGANRGLGLATARALAEQGYRVVATARTRDKAEAAAAELPGDVVPFEADVSSDASIEALGAFVKAEIGRADVLVNNAGATFRGDLGWGSSALDWDLDLIRRAFDTNTLGAFRTARALVPLMVERGWGRVVNVSTGMAQLSDMGRSHPAYRMSKTALNALTRILHAEYGDQGIKANAVCPGWVRTDMGGTGATRSIAEGIAGILWAATLPDDGPSGGFFRDGKPIPW